MAARAKVGRQLRESGQPSYRTIARRSYDLSIRTNRRDLLLSSSTVFRMVNGTHKPKWESVEALMLCLRVPPTVIEQVWRPAWLELMDVLKPLAGGPVSEFTAEEGADEAASGIECPLCGAWVTNPEVHEAWHRRNGEGGQPGNAGRERALRAVS